MSNTALQTEKWKIENVGKNNKVVTEIVITVIVISNNNTNEI